MLSKKPDFFIYREDLLNYIMRPFTSAIDIFQMSYDRYFQSELPQEILNNFFVSSCNASMRVWDRCIVDIACPPVTGTTEDSYHAYWDALIIKPILIGCPEAVYN